MSCSHAEAVARYRQDLAQPVQLRLAKFPCSCGARVDREQARALYFARLEEEKHSRQKTHGVYPADLDAAHQADQS